MNNLNNTSGLSFQNNVKSAEINEARQRMNNSMSMGMTSGMNNSLTNNMGTQGQTSSFGSVPSLNNSLTTDNSEIQQVRQKMNQFSSSTPLNNNLS